MKNGIAATMLILALLVGAGLGYLLNAPKTSPGTSTIQTPSTVTTTVNSRGPEAILMTINGSQYYADDVSDYMVVQNPGYSYLLNGSITFMGVMFEMNCPPVYSGCPQPPGDTNQTRVIVMLGVVSFNMTWQQDKSSETVGGVIGDLNYVYFLSKRIGPSAGMLFEYVPNASQAKAFLLVQNLY